MDRADPLLQKAIERIDIPSVLIGHRLISKGDERGLMPEEAEAFANSVLKRRRASGAARIVARELLSRRGYAHAPLQKLPSGAVAWPKGTVGSMAHDARVAVAAIGDTRSVRALGIDIEPGEGLPFDLDLVATPRERREAVDTPHFGRLLFCAKEAVYKAVHPLEGVFLEFHDVEIDFKRGKARVRHQRDVELRYFVSSQIVTAAFLLS
ncbi:MAG: 4'-phosphopantetheinyl transferase superfamily protein [Pseudolabrys sp.]